MVEKFVSILVMEILNLLFTIILFILLSVREIKPGDISGKKYIYKLVLLYELLINERNS